MPIINMVYKKKKGWKPGANTLLYVPMKDDFNDHSQNHFTLTNSGVALAQNQANIPVGNFNGSAYLSGANSSLFNFGDFHLGAWVKLSQIKQSQFIFAGIGSGNIFFGYWTYSGDKIGIGRNTVARDSIVQYSLNTGGWYYISYDRSGTNLSISVNSNVIGTLTNNISYNTSGGYQIGNDGYGYNIYGYMSEFILENKARTAQEVANYYNLTKSNYQPSLKSYEEIIAYTDKDAMLTELNIHPTEYYNKLNSEGHYRNNGISGTDNINYFTINSYYFQYSNGVWSYVFASGGAIK